MRRFFIEPEAVNNDRCHLDLEESHHLVKVLRLRVGDPVELFDGTGTLHRAEILDLGKHVAVKVLSTQRHHLSEEGSIVLCQGELKGGNMDFLVEKCTELGVDRFIPFRGGRSQGRRDAERIRRRRERRGSIVKTACKQCGRLDLMQVDQEITFEELLSMDSPRALQKIILLEKTEAPTLGESIVPAKSSVVWLMIGPEGGFTEDEIMRAQSADWRAACLGSLILRAETAALVSVAIAGHLMGRL